ncbi:C1 family peptidase [Calothrix sp. PCC 7507]|uniref:C1 family peptidase n=1 Tax=Calothrix sp. PCC 7507 TaxID=99598 RepID=UPI00029F2A6A|nr:C1 family peptidase [Calothrix sp. PCC 7507]AFY35988.1 peptidase C1A papain [Calothrix sp. PCC 7507]
MKNKGTGWIPDYPDINDFTLQSEALQNLTNRIQSQKETGSIENLARKISEALGILAKTGNVDADKQKFSELQNGLEQEILGENSQFVTVKLHNVFQVGMADSEVLLIKNYLQRILWTWKFNSSDNIYEIMDITKLKDATFDVETSKMINQVLNTQQRLQNTIDDQHGSIDKDDMEAIKELADLSIIIDSPSFLKDLPDRWQKWSDPRGKNPRGETEIFTKRSFQHFQSGQIKLIIHLFELLKKLQCETFDFIDILDIAKIQKSKKNIEDTIQYLKDHKGDIVNGLLCVTRNGGRWIKDYHGNAIALTEITKKYDPLIGVSDAKNEEWINNSEAELNSILEKINGLESVLSLENEVKQTINKIAGKIYDEKNIPETEEIEEYDAPTTIAAAIKKGIEEKISEWQKFMKAVYQIVPPQIPPQSLKERIEPVPSPSHDKLIELCQKNLMNEESSGTEIENQIRPLIDAIIKLIAQVLMPLAKYGNLNQAVEQVIKRLHSVIGGDNNPENQKTRELMRETIEEYNFRLIRDFNLIENPDFLKFMLGVILQQLDEIHDKNQSSQSIEEQTEETKKAKKAKFKEYLQQVLQSIGNTYPLIYCLVKKISEYNDDQLNDLRKFVRFKKTLLEIQEIKQITSIDASNNSCQYTESNLQLPIHFKLRNQFRKLQEDNCQKNPPESKSQRVFFSLPEFVDLSYWCSPIEDQGSINSCTAHAGIALMEYAEKKSSGNYTDASPLFLYKVTRNLMQAEGDSGASVRDTMKAMVAFGVCPENYWSYDEAKFDEQPTPFCYSFAENYKTLKYFRLDYGSISRYTLLSQVKVLLAAELPCIFGFTLYKSVYDEANTVKGHIPLPNKQDRVIGGHTVVAVGYHDRKPVENADGIKSEGALLIRNSWGTRWGQGGYGWLPYDYIVKGLTADWWSLLKAEWLASGRFGAGASAWNADKGGTPGDTGDD